MGGQDDFGRPPPRCRRRWNYNSANERRRVGLVSCCVRKGVLVHRGSMMGMGGGEVGTGRDEHGLSPGTDDVAALLSNSYCRRNSSRRTLFAV